MGGGDSAGVPCPLGAGGSSTLLARPTSQAVAGKRGRSPTDPREDGGGDTDDRRIRPPEGSMAMVLFASSTGGAI